MLAQDAWHSLKLNQHYRVRVVEHHFKLIFDLEFIVLSEYRVTVGLLFCNLNRVGIR